MLGETMYHSDPIINQRIENEIKRRIDKILQREKDIAFERKEKLRAILEKEQNDVEVCNEKKREILPEQRYREMEMKLFDIESKKERRRIEEAEKRVAMQKVLNCEEARQILSKQKDDKVKTDQLWQIGEKLAISSKKAEEDKYYHDLMIKNFQESIKLEESETQLAWKKQTEAKMAYLEQMEWKKQVEGKEYREREKEQLELKLAIAEANEREKEELHEKRKKSEELARELKIYMDREREMRVQREKEEKSLQTDISLFIDDSKKIQKNKMENDLPAFQDCLDNIKRQRKIEERQFDERLEQLAKQMETRKDEEKKRITEARLQLMQSVYEGRQEQLREKAEKEKQMVYEDAIEKQHVYNDIEKYKWEMDKERKSEQERKRTYAEQLMRQIRERNEAKQQAEIEKKREREKALSEEAQRKADLDYLINHPPDNNNHPLRGVKLATNYV